MESSGFDATISLPPDAERLTASGATCDGYRIRRYGKLLFVKRLKQSLAGDPRYRAALRKEFETGYTLEHPSLVRYVECGDDYLDHPLPFPKGEGAGVGFATTNFPLPFPRGC
ncbi:MAG: hypothetical protein IJ724_05000 [Muribaculaceae bacterium]|nr:hypothetical protein [Muribaculaceae bacterium]